jgi:hypothetical protein
MKLTPVSTSSRTSWGPPPPPQTHVFSLHSARLVFLDQGVSRGSPQESSIGSDREAYKQARAKRATGGLGWSRKATSAVSLVGPSNEDHRKTRAKRDKGGGNFLGAHSCYDKGKNPCGEKPMST